MSSQLQQKLQQFEATPPKDLWQAIEDRLDDNNILLQERLLAFEEVPQASCWQHIEASLSSNFTDTKPQLLKISWFRYAVAAIILGIVATGIFMFSINKPENTLAQQPASQNQKETTDTKQLSPDENKTFTSETNENSDRKSVTGKEEFQQKNLSNTLTSTTSKRYKVVTKEDGKLVRFSQKALEVFDCAVKATAKNNIRCKENIQGMQEKMANSMASPTADFAGLIDMIKTLEENK